MSTLSQDLQEIAADYHVLRSAPGREVWLTDAERQRVAEELQRDGTLRPSDWYEGLVEIGEGYWTLAGWLAATRRKRDQRRERIAAEAARAKAPQAAPDGHQGWPVAPGQPEAAYLLWLSALAVMRSLRARATADRYVGAGLVRRQHADRVLKASGRGDSGRERSENGRREVEAIEREVRAAA